MDTQQISEATQNLGPLMRRCASFHKRYAQKQKQIKMLIQYKYTQNKRKIKYNTKTHKAKAKQKYMYTNTHKAVDTAADTVNCWQIHQYK